MISLKKLILLFFDNFYFLKKTFFKKEHERSNLLRILIYHDINTESQIQKFENQIISLKKEFQFISPYEFENSKNFIGKKLLLSFDDGFKSNRNVVEKILDKHKIKAIFFIPSEFIGLKKETLEYKKIIGNIYPNGPKEEQKSLPMNLEDLNY